MGSWVQAYNGPSQEVTIILSRRGNELSLESLYRPACHCRTLRKIEEEEQLYQIHYYVTISGAAPNPLIVFHQNSSYSFYIKYTNPIGFPSLGILSN